MAELDNPQRGLRVIHIAGSKGKGSTALYAESLLAALDRRTFTFTSPHLERWTERLRLNGAEAPPERALAALQAVRDASHRCGIVPGFFEALTVAGLWLAAAERVDWCVIECGIGGRADATNIVEPAATIITGIVKPGAPLVAPRLAPELDAILASKSGAAGVRFLRVEQLAQPPGGAGDTDLAQWYYNRDGLIAAGPDWQLQAPLAAPGAHMAGNAVLALSALKALALISCGQMRHMAAVLARTSLPGRMETVSERPWVIVDGAHTGASASALAATIATLGARRLHLLLSCSSGKDLDAVLSPLLAEAAAVTITRADPDWSLPATALGEHVRAHQGEFAVEVIESPREALTHACRNAPEGTLILATGSVYLAGAVRAIFPRDRSNRAAPSESGHQTI